MTNEEEFYKDYYKYFSDNDKNVFDFEKKVNKKLKFGSQGAIVRINAFDGNTMSINLNLNLSNDFIQKLDRRINRIQKALEDIRNDLRKSEEI